MTVVIGIIASNYLVFASDGFALYQDSNDSPTYKKHIHNKICLLENNKFLIGSAGAHQVEFKIDNLLKMKNSKALSEKRFLKDFGNQVININQNDDGKLTSFIIGYLINNKPRMYLFKHDGDFERQTAIAALGSGADLAMEYLSPIYSKSWKIQEAVDKVISAIFKTSKIPTVNFLPMISILSSNGSLDLSCKTVSLFKSFKNDLRKQLVHTTKQFAQIDK